MSLLQDKFEAGMFIPEYEEKLEDQKALHQHHYKKAQVTEFLEELKDKIPALNILVITEPWCGDSLAIVPVILKFIENRDDIQIRFLLRDENLDLIDKYLTKGGRAIPKLVVMDSEYNELFNWGPRPVDVQEIFEDHRQMITDGEIEKIEVIKKIRAFYSKDRGKTILNDFTSVLIKNC